MIIATIPPSLATQKATIVARRIVRMRQARARVADDLTALTTIRANLRSATAALRAFNRARRGRALTA